MSADARIAGLLSIAEQVLELARAHGIQDADAVASRGSEFEVKVADGEILHLGQAISKGLGLRIFVEGKLGFCTTSDFRLPSLKALVERAVLLAREIQADPFNGLADGVFGHMEDADALELYDPAVCDLSADTKIRWAHQLEEVARATDPRVTKFRDSGVSSGDSVSILVSSRGATRTIRGTGISAWCNPIACADGQLQTEVWYDSKTHLADLDSIESIGRKAAERAARMLGARPVKTQKVPVIYEPHMAAGLLAGILGAVDGDMVFKKASFLWDKLGTQIAVPGLTLIDDPLLPRGVSTAPFDGEGLPTYKKTIIEGGVLATFLYDSYTARKASARCTHNARRGYASLPHTGAFNVSVKAGDQDPKAIWRDCPKAFVMTRGLGSGVNTVTGEYSRGANGLWLEHGEVVHPVQEVTVAGDFLTMLRSLDAFGSDFQQRGSLGAPTIRVAEMTISGQR